MKHVYENFRELAEAMCDGEGRLHASNCAQHAGIEDPCIAWQYGVIAFARWLDHIGCKVEIADAEENFYDFVIHDAH